MEYTSLALHIGKEQEKSTPQSLFKIHCYLADLRMNRKHPVVLASFLERFLESIQFRWINLDVGELTCMQKTSFPLKRGHLVSLSQWICCLPGNQSHVAFKIQEEE